MSNLTDSLRGTDDTELKAFLLDRLSLAEEKVAPFAGITSKEDYPECVYWQGQKDALRAVLALYLNNPMLADLSNTNSLSVDMRGGPGEVFKGEEEHIEDEDWKCDCKECRLRKADTDGDL